ncbi:MAG TPA: DUF1501 domain-containing protein [Phycisphaerae bacterium]|nr:DUF1501 domain-containing protein [Phycisphaerae bacterium]
MLDIRGANCGWSGRLGRRDFLRVGALGVLGLTLADWFRLSALGQVRDDAAKARSVIQLWMGGGPSHLDTFDPKPGAGEEYCGPYKKPVSTNVPDISLCEMLPMMAKQADKFSILRGMTHSAPGHETATYIMQTGTMPTGDLVYPALGAVVALKKGYEAGYQGALPPYVKITNPLGRFSETGFLGSTYGPFATGGDPSAKDFRVGGVAGGMSEQRMENRRSLLQAVDMFARDRDGDRDFQKMDSYQEKAFGLILGDAKKAFDLSQEDDSVRDRYGRNRFGQSCLLARRLVENGVLFSTVNWGGWDTHKEHFERMSEMLPMLDRGFSALLEDLSQRGLLDSTMVLWGGEFGRTPKILYEPPWNGGRAHYPTAFSCVVAGGGFAGGKVVGATDYRGERVRERPIYPWDLAASMYQLLGIDPAGKLPHPHGCVAYVVPTSGQSGGLLKEIM